mmetsp:Transcript_26586/g.26836  ORF Transcript_26586/g.26836 Transcript_26586/m.26836 type:complete len:118 (-) Transcript_26586:271-624(-)
MSINANLSFFDTLACLVPWLGAEEDEDYFQKRHEIQDDELKSLKEPAEIDTTETVSDVSDSEWNEFESAVKHGDHISSANQLGESSFLNKANNKALHRDRASSRALLKANSHVTSKI